MAHDSSPFHDCLRDGCGVTDSQAWRDALDVERDLYTSPTALEVYLRLEETMAGPHWEWWQRSEALCATAITRPVMHCLEDYADAAVPSWARPYLSNGS